MSDADEDTIGDGPIEERYHDKMNALSRAIDIYFNGKKAGTDDSETGFLLMVFPFEGNEGRANYISNTKRLTIITLLKEQLARFEGQPMKEGHA